MHRITLTQIRPPPRQFGLLVLLLFLLPSTSQAAGAIIEEASTQRHKGVYQLNANIRYELSDEVLEAINNGIAVSMQVTIKVERPRAYLWDQLIVEKAYHYGLKYHALSGQYLVKSSLGEQRSYLSLASALRALGQIRVLPILDQTQLQDPQDVMVRIKAELDINALPAPLRPVAWLSSQWALNSEWFSCPLQ